MNDCHRTFEDIYAALQEADKHWHMFVRSFWIVREHCQRLMQIGKGDIPFPPFPAAKNRSKTYTPRELFEASDPPVGEPNLEQEINLRHMVFLFSLLEALASEAEKFLTAYDKGKDRRYLTKRWNEEELNKFLLITKSLLPEEVKKFEFIREVRNCYVHRHSKADDKLAGLFHQTGASKPGVSMQKDDNIKLKFGYSDYEGWQEMILLIADRLKKHIESSAL